MRRNVLSGASAVALCFALMLPGPLLGTAQSNDSADARSHTANALPSDSISNEITPSGGCASAPKPSDALSSYVIGPGDVLAVAVWKDTELSRTMPVRPDGRISLPVLGELQAAGLTASQLQAQICGKLNEYIRNPQVNVIVAEIKSHTFNVVGKVAKAGSFELIKPTTVLDAIAVAGGFQEFARQTKIYVLRSAPDSPTVLFPFNYKQVIKGHRSDENVLLRPGDTVVVP